MAGLHWPQLLAAPVGLVRAQSQAKEARLLPMLAQQMEEPLLRLRSVAKVAGTVVSQVVVADRR
jgi:hypothetical protein